jgi:nucleoside-diphosphate-sugar epimerase
MVPGGGEASSMRVLVTGHRGYIGSVLVSVLQHARHEVVGLDCDWYGDCDFGRVRDSIPSFEMDVRDVEFTDLLSFDAMIHLAALPEDPSLQFDPSLTEEINFAATVRLAECCKQASVSRFLFASTCAVYGSGGGDPLNESGATAPITPYAVAKLRCEQELSRLSGRGFVPVVLRNATVYGVSPRLRLDTVVNEFVGSAVANGRVEMRTEGRAWRPLMHVEDVARAYAMVLAAADDAVADQIFNVAITEENYRVIDVADCVAELVPDCTRSVRTGVRDQRSYCVDGSKLRRAFPQLTWRWTLPQGIRQLRAAMLGAGLTAGEWRSDRYRRLLRLSTLMERGELDPSLRRQEPAYRELQRSR